ncbi:MAG: DUF4956 domain-containing protein [Verrucomicrobia bacterium]|nr:DUF4956 domain-containing protein [Verrucomicrobiota bacterium]
MMFLQADPAPALGFFSDLVNKLGDKYFLRLLTDAIAVCVLLFGIYYPNNHRNREYLFTMFTFNVVIFHIGFLLKSVELSLGAAFGLFAVFGLLRYRTEDIPMKDMTYLFISIAIGLIVAVTQGDWEPAVVCCIILLPTFLLDSSWIFRKQVHKDVRYEQVEMVKPENHEKLKEELRKRTGLDIHFIRVLDIDFVRDTATIRIFYYERT